MTLQQLIQMWSLVPALKSLPAAPRRAILHWTAGTSKANSTDKAHYHFIFNQPTGEIVPGDNPVAANMKTLTGTSGYAGHTGGFNSFSAGFSFAGHHYENPKSNPLLEAQVKNGLAFVGLCMAEWGLDPLNRDHLFTHMEAWTVHKVKGQVNDQKTDIDHLTFLPALKRDQVGDWLRAETKRQQEAVKALLSVEPTVVSHPTLVALRTKLVKP